MPIKKENKHLYPDNWLDIRDVVTERAGCSCEKCQVRNRACICRGKVNGKDVYQYENGEICDAEDGTFLGEAYVGSLEGDVRFIEVVCTVAHLDHDPTNNSLDNLRFWCQRCHNRYDRSHRNQTMREGKLKGQNKLF